MTNTAVFRQFEPKAVTKQKEGFISFRGWQLNNGSVQLQKYSSYTCSTFLFTYVWM